jgi:four helix bundle protein
LGGGAGAPTFPGDTWMAFQVYDVSLELIVALREPLEILRRLNPDLTKQAWRAAESVPLNIREGNRRGGADRKYHFNVAAGSADEVVGALDVACARGQLRENEVAAARALVDRVLAMLRKLR